MEAEQPTARPEERPWLRTRPCHLQPTSQKAEGEAPGVKGRPLPASPQLRCVFRGQRVSYMWRAPAWKGRGPGSNSKVFQAWAEAKFSCLGTRLAGGLGESKEAVHSLSRKKGLVTEGQEPGLGRMPVTQALSSRICPGDPEAETPMNRRCHRVGGRMGCRGSIPPQT